MNQKPVHYDGSVQVNAQENEQSLQESFVLTDEMRKSIGQNPYSLDINE